MFIFVRQFKFPATPNTGVTFRKHMDSIWCGLKEILVYTDDGVMFKSDDTKVESLKDALKSENRYAIYEFRQLMTITDREINLTFVSRFLDLFKVNLPCICKDLLESSTKTDMIFDLKSQIAAGKVGAAYLLGYDGGYLILKSIKRVIPKPYLSLRVNPISYYPNLLKIMNPGLEYNLWINEKTGAEQLISIAGDNFTNQTCIHMALNQILGGSLNYIYQYDAFYCGTNGYNVTNLANAGDLSSYLDHPDRFGFEAPEITEEFLIDLLTQILTPLSVLKSNRYAFSHSDLKCRNVFVNVNTDGSRTYMLADFDKSSIFWKGLRFYNQSGDYRLSDLPFEPKEGPEGVYYTIDNLQIRAGLPIQVYTMHNPFGFYLSYDLYTFWYSLMMEPVIWNYMKSATDGRVLSAWKSMWHRDQYDAVMADIGNTHDILASTGDKQSQEPMITSMRSIRTIANKFYEKGYKLKTDLFDMYSYFGLVVTNYEPKPVSDRTIQISAGGHVCVRPCRKSTGFRGGYKCDTNMYSNSGSIYTWDWC